MILKRGSTGTEVRQMQAVLGVTPDGVFGPLTEAALKRWQSAHGLVADGVYGPLTAAKMFPPVVITSTLLQVGSVGPAVFKLQSALIFFGERIKADGVFGPATKAAVIAFQSAHGLAADGIVGPLTLAKLVIVQPVPVVPPTPVVQDAQHLAGRKIAVDEGHGWNNSAVGTYDPGACGNGREEHQQNVVVGNALTTEIIARGGESIRVTDMALAKRNPAAVSWGADTYVSIHFNAGGGTGTEVWVPLLAGPALVAKAEAIGKAVASVQGLRFRGVKRSGTLAVLKHFANAMLVEVNFIDNAGDCAAYDAHASEIPQVIANNL